MSATDGPRMGERVRRLEDGVEGVVAQVAAPPPRQLLMHKDDFEIRVDKSTSIITTGIGFWSRWERVAGQVSS